MEGMALKRGHEIGGKFCKRACQRVKVTETRKKRMWGGKSHCSGRAGWEERAREGGWVHLRGVHPVRLQQAASDLV